MSAVIQRALRASLLTSSSLEGCYGTCVAVVFMKSVSYFIYILSDSKHKHQHVGEHVSMKCCFSDCLLKNKWTSLTKYCKLDASETEGKRTRNMAFFRVALSYERLRTLTPLNWLLEGYGFVQNKAVWDNKIQFYGSWCDISHQMKQPWSPNGVWITPVSYVISRVVKTHFLLFASH